MKKEKMLSYSLSFLYKNRYIYLAFLLLIFLGFLASFGPGYIFAFFLFVLFLYLVSNSIFNTYTVMLILLLLQPALFYNADIIGIPAAILTVIKRSDEFIWLILLIILVFKQYNVNSWEVRLSGLEIPAILFCLHAINSMIVNELSLFWSLVSIFLTMKGLFIYILSKNLNINFEKIKSYINILVTFFLIIFFIGFIQYFGVNLPFLPKAERFGIRVATSIFGHHAFFGLVMAVGYGITAGIYFGTRKKRWIILAFIFMVGVILSSVRKSMVGLIIGTLYVLYNYRKLKISKKDLFAAILLLLVIFIAFYGRFIALIKGTDKEYIRGKESNRRWILYIGAYKILKNKPFFGEGPGRYGTYVSVVTKSDVYLKYGVEMEDMYKVDTFWAYVAGEFGIVGIILMLFYLFSILINLHKLINLSPQNNFLRGLIASYLIIFIDFLIESPTIGLFNLSFPAYILFGGLGMLENVMYKEFKS